VGVLRAAIVAALCGWNFAAQAQIVLQPAQNDCNACSVPQSLPAVPVASPAFRLKGIRLSGAQALPAAEFDALAAPLIGRDVTLPRLEALAQQIGALYRERGYFLAQAVIPVQTVDDGVVEISVIEGRLGRINVNLAPDAPISEERVRAFLAPLEAGQALSGPVYERAMLLLSDQPGLRVSSQLEAGVQPGATDLTVEVAAGPRWAFSADADNHGTRETGRYRAGGGARWMSPAGIGDNLDARLIGSDGGGLVFGRVSYEAPIGADGLRAGAGLSHIDYQVGGEFQSLDAHGTADVLDASLSYPLIRSRQQNLFLRLGAEVKNLKDNYGAVEYSPRKRTTGLSMGWAWERRDTLLGGGYWASSGAVYRGRLDIRDAVTAEADRDPILGRRTEGGFTKLGFQFSRLQRIVDDHALYLVVGGQWASKNLDASEKLSLGGARAVRAYPSGEVLADEGVIGAVEWRWSVNEAWTPYVFYDAARGRLSRRPLPGETGNTRSLRGAGIGVQWAGGNGFSVNATLAWRAGTPRAATDGGGHNPRLYVQLQKVF
jgi:hemolysin activation/secretion protein